VILKQLCLLIIDNISMVIVRFLWSLSGSSLSGFATIPSCWPLKSPTLIFLSDVCRARSNFSYPVHGVSFVLVMYNRFVSKLIQHVMNVCAICTAVIDEVYHSQAWTFLKKLTRPTLPTFLLWGTENPGSNNRLQNYHTVHWWNCNYLLIVLRTLSLKYNMACLWSITYDKFFAEY
jgi:hypothetical protein